MRKLRVILKTVGYPDVERLRVEREGRMERTWVRDLGQTEAEANRVLMRRDMKKDNFESYKT